MLTTHHLGGETRHRGMWGGGNRARQVGLVVWVIISSFLTLYLRIPGLLMSVLLLLLVMWGTTERGRDTWYLVWRDNWLWRKRVKRGFTKFRPVQDRPVGFELDEVEANTFRDWPEGAEGLYWLQSEPGVPGIAWHLPPAPESPYLSVTWRVQGAIRGIEPDHVVNRATKAFAQLTAGTAKSQSLAKSIQMVTRVTRIDMFPHEEWVASEVRKTEQGDEFDAPEALLVSYDQLIGQMEASGLTQGHFLEVSWPLSDAFKHKASRRGPEQQGWLELMADEIKVMDRQLRRARLGRVQPISARELCAVIRHLQLPSWPSGDLSGVRLEQVGFPYDESARTHVISEGDDPYGQPDSWMHRTAEIPVRSLAAASYTALWLMPLLAGLPEQIHRTVSTHIVTVPAAAARGKARADLTSDRAAMLEERRKGVIADEFIAAGHQAAQIRHADLSPGSGVQGAGWAMHITISARNLHELRDARDIISGGAAEAGIETLDWLDSHHGAAMSWTWPIGRGMGAMSESATDRAIAALSGQDAEDTL